MCIIYSFPPIYACKCPLYTYAHINMCSRLCVCIACTIFFVPKCSYNFSMKTSKI